MRTESTRALWRVAAIVLSSALLAFAASSEEREERRTRADYTRKITDREVLDHVEGRKLDESDPEYCDKMRDVCLISLCGSFSERGANKQCWAHCYEKAHAQCEEKRRERR